MARKIKIDNAVLKHRQYQKRTHEKVDITCSILIVCEGEKTEPNYFKAFNKKRHGAIVYDLTFDGGGISTTKVVEKAIALRNKAVIISHMIEYGLCLTKIAFLMLNLTQQYRWLKIIISDVLGVMKHSNFGIYYTLLIELPLWKDQNTRMLFLQQ